MPSDSKLYSYNYRRRSRISGTLQGATMRVEQHVDTAADDDPRSEFHKHKDVGKKDFGTIEYLLRRGRNQLETWSEPGIRDIHR